MGAWIHRKLFRHIIFILAVGCFAVVSAKDKDKDAKEGSSDIKFTAHTELVLIPTLVTDKSGVHVSGLKKEDFTVRENGVEQKIATFEEVTTDSYRFSRPKDPKEFSNSLGGGESTRRMTLIVLDLINTPFVNQADAREQLFKFLSQSMDQREPTALYTLDRNGIHVIHDFTTDPRVLAAALRRIKGNTIPMVNGQEEVEGQTDAASPNGSISVDAISDEASRLQAMVADSELNFKSFQQTIAITDTLLAMQQVAQSLAGFPGRKSMIWASGGFPFNVSDNSMQLGPAGADSLTDVLPMYEHTWQLLTDAQIAVYPVDVRGLQTSMPRSSNGKPSRNFARNEMPMQTDRQATLRTFAAATGGRAYFNSNNLEKGFRDAVADSSEYYMLGYYLDRSNTKPGWRKLAIKVDREHAEVRGRNGFFVTHTTTDPESNRANDITLALRSPLDYSAVGLTVRWHNGEASKETGKKRINYHMNVAVDPSLIDSTDNNHIMLDFVALAKTADGKQVDPPLVNKQIEAHLKPEALEATRQKGVGYKGAFDIPPGEYSVRFVVRDDLNGRVGSVAAPLKVE